MFSKFRKDRPLYLGDGVSLSKQHKPLRISIDQKHRSGHFWCFGTTRSGKTRLIDGMIEQDIRAGRNIGFIDPKGDMEILAKIIQVARETGRMDDLIIIDPFFPDISARLNPLKHWSIIEELVGHTVAGIEVGREPFFFNVSYELTLVVVQALTLIAEADNTKALWNFEFLKNQISRLDLTELHNSVSHLDSDEARQIARDIRAILSNPPDYYGKVASSLRVALTELSQGAVGYILGQTTDENRILDRLYSGKGVIFVVRLASMMTRKASYTLGKVIISMIQAYVGRLFLSGQKLNPELCLYIDEAHNVLYQGIDDLFAKAGGAGCWVHGFCQSYNQLVAALKDRSLADSIMDNINTKMFLRVPDPITAKYGLEHFGNIRKFLPILSSDGHFSMREAEEALLQPDTLQKLQPRQFYMTTYSGAYKGITLPCEESYVKLKFPGSDASESVLTHDNTDSRGEG
ncbi:DNA transfer in the process of conjugation and F pilus assembly protein [Desulfurispirillum indicum S5]|uniref:DNA transfer in the process of conjugation and F pilus assembly protein n=1 Tax=Desulfurispirillum indicum (strain ATCC BAA-1389 / DSM 22839 / S5) TaxID=653733 RepID=E6W6D1_DESIS|nr:helicase HerA-like domain-containing protein [Desulfurispirillum indicum]ADU66167.1 DNA transfer in the process of conjugation and F pilus assembly protein [Desulfurispirillum indicum S5]